MKAKIVAEIGSNHLGSVPLCKKMIKYLSKMDCDYVKLQKRDPDECIPDKLKNNIVDSPWGKIKYIDYRKKLEFNESQVIEILDYCDKLKIKLFFSVWDFSSLDLLKKYFNIIKIPSPLISNLKLCKEASKFNLKIMSTGMSTEKQIQKCFNILNPNVIMHCVSIYPCPHNKVFLNYIKFLIEKYTCDIGYSGHEEDLGVSCAAVALGATWIEKHFSLNKKAKVSDSKVSLNAKEFSYLIKNIRQIELSLEKNKSNRTLFKEEFFNKNKLRTDLRRISRRL